MSTGPRFYERARRRITGVSAAGLKSNPPEPARQSLLAGGGRITSRIARTFELVT